MPSLRQITAAHAPLLIIDAASARVQVGVCDRDGTQKWAISEEEAGVGVFQCLEKLSVQPVDAGAFVYCQGPGSILGIRTVAMAIRTWLVFATRPVFAYDSLALVAHALGRPAVGVIADARRDAWHCYRMGRGLQRIPAANLEGELVMPENFRAWAPLPARLTRVPYLLSEILPAIAADEGLFQPIDGPDAFLHEEPSYVTWTPKVHRPPSAR